MEEAKRLISDFERWIAEEVLPKAVAISAHMHDGELDSPDWAKQAALQAAVKPFFYWSQDQASSKNPVSASASQQTGTGSSSLLNGGPQGELSSWITGHPQLTLVSGPPGTTKLGFREKVSPELWDTTHRLAKAAGYVYVAYNASTGESGHWKKVQA